MAPILPIKIEISHFIDKILPRKKSILHALHFAFVEYKNIMLWGRKHSLDNHKPDVTSVVILNREKL